MSADGLQQALAELGIECTVEARDKLAIIIPTHSALTLRNASVRRTALALLADHGFTHLALEIPDAPANDAPVSRD